MPINNNTLIIIKTISLKIEISMHTPQVYFEKLYRWVCDNL